MALTYNTKQHNISVHGDGRARTKSDIEHAILQTSKPVDGLY